MRNLKYSGRIDHIVWVCKSEHLEKELHRLSQMSGIEFEHPRRNDAVGLYTVADWSSGLELIAPVEDSEAWPAQFVRKFLEERGEGIFSVVLGVSSLEAERDRVSRLGFNPSPIVEQPHYAPSEPILVRESIVGNFLGTTFTLGEIEYHSDENYRWGNPGQQET